MLNFILTLNRLSILLLFNWWSSFVWKFHYLTNQKINAFAYFYNLGNVNKFSFVTNHGSCIPSSSEASIFSMVFGGTVLPQASVVDGIRIFNNQPTGASNISDGSNFKLYGIKELWVI